MQKREIDKIAFNSVLIIVSVAWLYGTYRQAQPFEWIHFIKNILTWSHDKYFFFPILKLHVNLTLPFFLLVKIISLSLHKLEHFKPFRNIQYSSYTFQPLLGPQCSLSQSRMQTFNLRNLVIFLCAC